MNHHSYHAVNNSFSSSLSPKTYAAVGRICLCSTRQHWQPKRKVPAHISYLEKSKIYNDWPHTRSVGDLAINKYLATKKGQITQKDNLF